MRCNNDPQSGQVLEFLTVTTHITNDEESRRIVRSHAIRDANRRKKLGVNKNPISEIAPPKTKPQSTFTAKFRLHKEKPSKKVAPSGVKGDAEGKDEEGLSKALSPLLRHRKIPSFSLLEQIEFDPFDVFPIKLGLSARAGVSERNAQTVFKTCSKERLFSSAAADPAWFNATLSLISLNYDLKSGRGISAECLYYRGEALRIVNQRLSENPRDVSDHTVAAIASLANFDVGMGV